MTDKLTLQLFDTILFMYWVQYHYQLNGRTVGISNDVLILKWSSWLFTSVRPKGLLVPSSKPKNCLWRMCRAQQIVVQTASEVDPPREKVQYQAQTELHLAWKLFCNACLWNGFLYLQMCLDANGNKFRYRKWLSFKTSSMTWPTNPVTPTTATLIPFLICTIF